MMAAPTFMAFSSFVFDRWAACEPKHGLNSIQIATMARGRMQRGIEPAEKDRRGAIRYALFECIRDKGYAATSLGDVASAAGLSPSHVLYYYANKDAVLEDLFAVATKNMREDLARLPWDS